MSDTVRWGILGCAKIARVCVIPAIQASRNGTVAAIASRFSEKAQDVGRHYGIVRTYSDYARLLDDPDIDAVYIPLPNHLHHPWTLNALDAGKHVLCEKPLAVNADEAREMAATADRAGLRLMEGFMYRFHGRSQRIHQMVAARDIGRPLLIRSAFCYRMAEADFNNPANARLNAQMGGGALLDVGCYGVSVARWMLGAEPVSAQAQAVFHPNDVDIHLVGTLRFPDDALAAIEASFVTALQQTYAVVGSRGAIELPQNAFIPWERDADFVVRGIDQEQGRRMTIKGEDEYRNMVEHFADAVSHRTELAFKPEESVRNMRALDALAQAARRAQTIDLKPPAATR